MEKQIRLLNKLKVGDTIEVYCPAKNRHYMGPIVKVFRANVDRNPAEVEKYFSMCENDRTWRWASRPAPLDWRLTVEGVK